MSPFILPALLFSLGLGTTLTFASTHWVLAWMGLEINTLAILPLLTQTPHPRAAEAATKYFLAQSAAAAMILFASTLNAWITGQWEVQQLTSPLPLTLLTLALGLKLGLAPLHSWLPEVLQGLNLSTGLILSTWQKLAPLALLFQLPPVNPSVSVALGLTSVLVGGWGGLNQTQLRKILAYSSVAHLGWMVLTLPYSRSLTLITLLIYLFMTPAIFLTLKLSKTTNINTLATAWTTTPTLFALFPLILLSLGGLPPLTGFAPKWLILQELVKQDLTPTATLAALATLLSLYFYLRLTYTTTLTSSPNTLTATTPWRLPTRCPSTPLALTATTAVALLPLTPALTALTTTP